MYSLLDALMPRIRQGILLATTGKPERWWYLSDLARTMGVRPSSLQRELASLVEAGILECRREGNRVYYRADPRCPILPELGRILDKTIGVVGVLATLLRPMADDIEVAVVYGSVAQGREASGSDVDLLVVGDASPVALSKPLREAERALGRQVNPVVYTLQEFAHARERHFLRSVLASPRLFIIGTEDDLARLAAGQAREGAHDERAEL